MIAEALLALVAGLAVVLLAPVLFVIYAALAAIVMLDNLSLGVPLLTSIRRR